MIEIESDDNFECPGLVKALENAKIVIPYPDYSGVLVWYGGTTVSILNQMGCTVQVQEVGTISESAVRERMETFMDQVRDRYESDQEGAES